MEWLHYIERRDAHSHPDGLGEEVLHVGQIGDGTRLPYLAPTNVPAHKKLLRRLCFLNAAIFVHVNIPRGQTNVIDACWHVHRHLYAGRQGDARPREELWRSGEINHDRTLWCGGTHRLLGGILLGGYCPDPADREQQHNHSNHTGRAAYRQSLHPASSFAARFT